MIRKKNSIEYRIWASGWDLLIKEKWPYFKLIREALAKIYWLEKIKG